jgi:predicted RNase H-like HicB family nuclease
MKLSYPAIFYPWDEGGGYTVEVPDLPGCVSEGDSLPEAILMGADAASGWVLDEFEDGRPAPPASPIGAIKPEEESGFVSMLVLDMDEYAKKHGQKAIRKTLDLEIPAYLATFAESRRLDISRIAQDALSELFLKQP